GGSNEVGKTDMEKKIYNLRITTYILRQRLGPLQKKMDEAKKQLEQVLAEFTEARKVANDCKIRIDSQNMTQSGYKNLVDYQERLSISHNSMEKQYNEKLEECGGHQAGRTLSIKSNKFNVAVPVAWHVTNPALEDCQIDLQILEQKLQVLAHRIKQAEYMVSEGKISAKRVSNTTIRCNPKIPDSIQNKYDMARENRRQLYEEYQKISEKYQSQ
ncbi:unnamed protein product, partial [Owenia fusiformis]